jgi:hypothetical protein
MPQAGSTPTVRKPARLGITMDREVRNSKGCCKIDVTFRTRRLRPQHFPDSRRSDRGRGALARDDGLAAPAKTVASERNGVEAVVGADIEPVTRRQQGPEMADTVEKLLFCAPGLLSAFPSETAL